MKLFSTEYPHTSLSGGIYQVAKSDFISHYEAEEICSMEIFPLTLLGNSCELIRKNSLAYSQVINFKYVSKGFYWPQQIPICDIEFWKTIPDVLSVQKHSLLCRWTLHPIPIAIPGKDILVGLTHRYGPTHECPTPQV